VDLSAVLLAGLPDKRKFGKVAAFLKRIRSSIRLFVNLELYILASGSAKNERSDAADKKLGAAFGSAPTCA